MKKNEESVRWLVGIRGKGAETLIRHVTEVAKINSVERSDMGV